jgi:hypothetical protein
MSFFKTHPSAHAAEALAGLSAVSESQPKGTPDGTASHTNTARAQVASSWREAMAEASRLADIYNRQEDVRIEALVALKYLGQPIQRPIPETALQGLGALGFTSLAMLGHQVNDRRLANGQSLDDLPTTTADAAHAPLGDKIKARRAYGADASTAAPAPRSLKF